MNEMNITDAKYLYHTNDEETIKVAISATIDGENITVAVNAEGNRHYNEIMRQVEAGTLTIAEAE